MKWYDRPISDEQWRSARTLAVFAIAGIVAGLVSLFERCVP